MVEDYYLFKQDLLNKTRYFPDKVIGEVVGEYASVIDSKRRCSVIKNVPELISVLEKRCHVSSDDYSELRNIVNRLPAEEKRTMLARLHNRRPVGYGEDNSNNNGPQNSPLQNPPVQNPRNSSANYDGLPACVVELISSEIGIKWREFARKLELREGDLNSIESIHGRNDYKTCAYEALMRFQSRSDRQNLRRNLLQALEKARRKDLQHNVQKLFDNMD